jgi:hypothetical protein
MPADTRVHLTRSEFDAYVQSIHGVLVKNVKTASDIRNVQKDLEDLVQKITKSKLHILINKIVQQLILILDAAFSGFLVCNPEFTQEQAALFLQRCIDRALDVDENQNALLMNYILIVPDPVSAPVTESLSEPVVEPVVEPVPEAASEPVPESVAEPEAASEPVPESVAEPVPESVAEPEAASEPVAEPVSVPEPAAESVPVTKKLTLKF